MKPVVLHPRARGDILQIVKYYDTTAGTGIAEDFFAELRNAFIQVGSAPGGYAVQTRDIRAPTSIASHITSYFESFKTGFAYSSCATMRGIRHSARNASNSKSEICTAKVTICV